MKFPHPPPLPVHDHQITGLQFLQELTLGHWVYFALFMLGLLIACHALVSIWNSRNKLLLSGAFLLFVGIALTQWIHDRNEPAFMTPTIDCLVRVLHLPAKGLPVREDEVPQ